MAEYMPALAKGSALTGAPRRRIAQRLARYAGVSPAYAENSDLRIQIWRFCRELLRDEKRTVGRLDSRFKGIDIDAAGEGPEFDPSMAAIRPPYTAMLNDYIRTQLGYKTDVLYSILGEFLSESHYEKWDWGSAGHGHPDTSDALRQAFVKNPYMKLFIASGYFDLATPYFATKFTLDHMGLDPSLAANITTGEYEAGHMMYIDTGCLAKLHSDVSGFLKGAVKP
jgi:carboxypeptidase C (cathepsin A)